MRLVTFIHRDLERIGAVTRAGQIVDLARAYGLYLCKAEGQAHGEQLAPIILGRNICEFLQRGENSLTAVRKVLAWKIAYLK